MLQSFTLTCNSPRRRYPLLVLQLLNSSSLFNWKNTANRRITDAMNRQEIVYARCISYAAERKESIERRYLRDAALCLVAMAVARTGRTSNIRKRRFRARKLSCRIWRPRLWYLLSSVGRGRPTYNKEATSSRVPVTLADLKAHDDARRLVNDVTATLHTLEPDNTRVKRYYIRIERREATSSPAGLKRR